MTHSLHGKGTLVTGGSRGIGRAVTARLAADGATVAFTYAANSDAADELLAEIHAAGGRAHALRLDLAEAEPEEVADTVAEARRLCGGLDILVANAGITAYGAITELDTDTWDRVMRVNARGCFLTLRHAAPLLADGGRIVTISTIGTAWPSPGEAVYAASKAAVEQLSRVASRELGARGITVNTISPGPTDTDLLRAGAPQEALDGAAAMTALGRIGHPTDIAGVVAQLVHPAAGWLTGQNLRADGGLS